MNGSTASEISDTSASSNGSRQLTVAEMQQLAIDAKAVAPVPESDDPFAKTAPPVPAADDPFASAPDRTPDFTDMAPADPVEHGKIVLAAVIGHRSPAALDQVVRQLRSEHFTDSAQRKLAEMIGQYHTTTGGILTRAAVADLSRGQPAGQAFDYQEYYDLLTEVRVTPVQWAWSLFQLREQAKERLTGAAITQGMEILTRGAKDEHGNLLRGPDDARQYLAERLGELTAAASPELTPVDWASAWEQQPEDVDWLAEPFIEAGKTVSLFAQPGVGKSLLALETGAALAAGRPVLGNPARDPVPVLYIDHENLLAELVERLRAMGYQPADLTGLTLLSYPDMAKLDTAEGGAQLLSLAENAGARLIIIDTMSRVIDGEENDSSTYISLYTHTVEPLRKAGIALLRLDHPGKDSSKGTRGSSAKFGDVDVEWELTAETALTFRLDCRKDRPGHNPGREAILIRRCSEPLRHEVTHSSATVRAVQLLADLGRLNVPRGASRRVAAPILRAAGIRVSNPVLDAALRQWQPMPDLEPPALGDGSEDGSGGDDDGS